MDWVVDTNNLLILGIAPYYFFAGLGILFSVSLFILLLLHMRIDIDKNAIQRIECVKRFVTDIEIIAFAKIFDISFENLLLG